MTENQSRLDGVDSMEALLGHEGSAAKCYFAALSCFNRSVFKWEGRVKHPATDPLNGLLSLTYTLILNEITALVQAHGLDSSIGFMHQIDGNRPSLALDLMEPFRAPAADRFVWTLANRQQFGPEDFEQRDPAAGVFLRTEALHKFFETYEKWLLTPVGGGGLTFRAALRAEVAAFAKYLRDPPGALWSPFCFRTAKTAATPSGQTNTEAL